MQHCPTRFSSQEEKQICDNRELKASVVDLINKTPKDFEETLQYGEIINIYLDEENKASKVSNPFYNLTSKIDQLYHTLSKRLDPNENDYDLKSATKASSDIGKLLRIENHRTAIKPTPHGDLTILNELLLFIFDHQEATSLIDLIVSNSAFKLSNHMTLMYSLKFRNFESMYMQLVSKHIKILTEQDQNVIREAFKVAKSNLVNKLRSYDEESSLSEEFFNTIEQKSELNPEDITLIKNFLLKNYKTEIDMNSILAFEICGILTFILDLSSFQKGKSLALATHTAILSFKTYKIAVNLDDDFNDTSKYDLMFKSYLHLILKTIHKFSAEEQGNFFACFLQHLKIKSTDNDSFNLFLFDKNDGYLVITILNMINKIAKEINQISYHGILNYSLFDIIIKHIGKLISGYCYKYNENQWVVNQNYKDYKESALDFIHKIVVELEYLIGLEEFFKTHTKPQFDILSCFFNIINQNRTRPCPNLNFKRACQSYFQNQVYLLKNPKQGFKKRTCSARYHDDMVSTNILALKQTFDLDWGEHNIKHFAIDFFNALGEANYMGELSQLFKDDLRTTEMTESSTDFFVSCMSAFIRLMLETKGWSEENLDAICKAFDTLDKITHVNSEIFKNLGEALGELYEDESSEMYKRVLYCCFKIQQYGWDRGLIQEINNLEYFYRYTDKIHSDSNFKQTAKEYLINVADYCEKQVTKIWAEFMEIKLEPYSKEMKNWAHRLSIVCRAIQSGYYSFFNNCMTQGNFDKTFGCQSYIQDKIRSVLIHPIMLFDSLRNGDAYKKMHEFGKGDAEKMFKARMGKIFDDFMAQPDDLKLPNAKFILENFKESTFIGGYNFLAKVQLTESEYQFFFAYFYFGRQKLKFESEFIIKAINSIFKMYKILMVSIPLDNRELITKLANTIIQYARTYASSNYQYSEELLKGEHLGEKLIAYILETMLSTQLPQATSIMEDVMMTPDRKFLQELKSIIDGCAHANKPNYETLFNKLIKEAKTTDVYDDFLLYLNGKFNNNDQSQKNLIELLNLGIFPMNFLSNSDGNKYNAQVYELAYIPVSNELMHTLKQVIVKIDDNHSKFISHISLGESRLKSRIQEDTLITHIKNANILIDIVFTIFEKVFALELSLTKAFEEKNSQSFDNLENFSDAIMNILMAKSFQFGGFDFKDEYLKKECLNFLDKIHMLKNTIVQYKSNDSIAVVNWADLKDFSLKYLNYINLLVEKLKFDKSIYRHFWDSLTLISRYSGLSREEIFSGKFYLLLLENTYGFNFSVFDSAFKFYCQEMLELFPFDISIQAYCIYKSNGSSKLEVNENIINSNLNILDLKPEEAAALVTKTNKIENLKRNSSAFVISNVPEQLVIENFIPEISGPVYKVLEHLVEVIINRMLSHYKPETKVEKNLDTSMPSLILYNICHRFESILHLIAFSSIDKSKFDFSILPLRLQNELKREKISFLEFLVKIGLRTDPDGAAMFIRETFIHCAYTSTHLGDLKKFSLASIHWFIIESVQNSFNLSSENLFGELVNIYNYIQIESSDITNVGSNQEKETIYSEFWKTLIDWAVSQDLSVIKQGDLFGFMLHYYVESGPCREYEVVNCIFDPENIKKNPIEYFDLLKEQIKVQGGKFIDIFSKNSRERFIMPNIEYFDSLRQKIKEETYPNPNRKQFNTHASLVYHLGHVDMYSIEPYKPSYTLNKQEKILLFNLKRSRNAKYDNESRFRQLPPLGQLRADKSAIKSFIDKVNLILFPNAPIDEAIKEPVAEKAPQYIDDEPEFDLFGDWGEPERKAPVVPLDKIPSKNSNKQEPEFVKTPRPNDPDGQEEENVDFGDLFGGEDAPAAQTSQPKEVQKEETKEVNELSDDGIGFNLFGEEEDFNFKSEPIRNEPTTRSPTRRSNQEIVSDQAPEQVSEQKPLELRKVEEPLEEDNDDIGMGLFGEDEFEFSSGPLRTQASSSRSPTRRSNIETPQLETAESVVSVRIEEVKTDANEIKNDDEIKKELFGLSEEKKVEEISEIKKEINEEKYKYFLGRYFKTVEDFKKAIKSTSARIKERRELEIVAKTLGSNELKAITLEEIGSKNYKDTFEKNSVIFLMSNQNRFAIDPSISELAGHIKDEFIEITQVNFEAYKKFCEQFKQPSQIESIREIIPEKKPEEEKKDEETKSNGENGSVLDEENYNDEYNDENKEVEITQGSIVSDISDLNRDEFLKTNKENVELIDPKIEDYYFFKSSDDKTDFIGQWLYKSPVYNNTERCKYSVSTENENNHKEFKTTSHCPFLKFLKFFLHKFESDNLRDYLIKFSYDANVNPHNQILFLDLLLFMAHSPKLFEESLNETGYLYDEIKPFVALNYIETHELFVRNLIIYIEENCLGYLNVSSEFINQNGLEELVLFKEKYSYNSFAQKCCNLRGLAAELIFYYDFIHDPNLVKKAHRIISENIEGMPDVPIYPGYDFKIDHALGVAFKMIARLYPNHYQKLDELVNNTLLEEYEAYPELFLEMIPFYHHKLNNYFELSHEALASAIKSIREGKLVNYDLLNGEVHVIQLILSALNYHFCKFFFYTKFEKKNLSEYNNNMKALLNEKLAEFINALSSQSVKSYMLSLFEILEMNHKHKNSLLNIQNIKALVLIGVSYCSILSLKDQLNHTEEILPEPLPVLTKFVSMEDPDIPDISSFTLSRTFSTMRNDSEIELSQVITNFGLKYSDRISNLLLAKYDKIRIEIVHLFKKYPWIFDLKGKREILNFLILKNSEGDYPEQIDVQRGKELKAFKSHMKQQGTRKKLQKDIEIKFINEPGIDAGGLRREFYTNLMKKIFNPDLGLFKITASGKGIDINPNSSLIPRHLMYFELAGIALGKVIVQKISVDLSFSRSLLKHLLGKNIALSDMEDIDPELTKNFKWILENDCTDLGIYFTYETEILGEVITKDLIPDGSQIEVTNENKKDYVRKFCEMKMQKEIEQQLRYFIHGFRTILSLEWVAHFSPMELEILISGPYQIDIVSMKRSAMYKGHSPSDDLILWLWELLESLSQSQICQFMYFLTGSSKVAVGGFEKNPIKITNHSGGAEDLPVAHTCFNELELPKYSSKEMLEEKILMALYEGKDGFFVI